MCLYTLEFDCPRRGHVRLFNLGEGEADWIELGQVKAGSTNFTRDPQPRRYTREEVIALRERKS